MTTDDLVTLAERGAARLEAWYPRSKIDEAAAIRSLITELKSAQLAAQPTELDALFQRVALLEAEIKSVLTQEFDDICWMDVYSHLAEVVGIAWEPKMLPRERMLKNCERFVDSMIAGCPYQKGDVVLAAQRYEGLKAALEQVSVDSDWLGIHLTKCDNAEWFAVLDGTGTERRCITPSEALDALADKIIAKGPE